MPHNRFEARPIILAGIITSLAFFTFIVCGGNAQVDALEVSLGSAIYEKNCQSCHGDAATGEGALPNVPVHGPEGHTWHHADGQLSEIILGQFDYPGRTMPSFAGELTEDDVTAVLTYFKTNWHTEQREFQAEVTRNWEELRDSRQ